MSYTRSLPGAAEWSEHIRTGVTAERVLLPVSARTGQVVSRPDGGHHGPEGLVLDGRLLGAALARGTRDLLHQFHDLGAEFAYPLAPLLNELRVQGGLLTVLADSLNMPDERVEAQSDIGVRRRWAEARELYGAGCAKAAELLFPEALEWLRKADERYPTDFSIQFELGWVCLYGVSQDDDTVDLAAAENHFRRAVRYGKGAVRRRPDMAAPTAEALLHLSIACWLPGRREEALQLAAEACDVSPKLGQGYYHRAKYAAVLGRRDEALAGVRAAISLDRRFALTLDSDADLASTRPEIERLLEEMRAELRAAAENAVAGSAAIGGMKAEVATFRTRRAGQETRFRNVEVLAGGYPADYSELPGVSIEVRRAFDEDCRTVRRAQEKLDRLLARSERALAEAEALFDRCRQLQAQDTLFALQDVLPLAAEAAAPLRRATTNLADAVQFTAGCDDRLPVLEGQVPALAVEAERNRAAHRHWWFRDVAAGTVQRLPGYAFSGALGGILLRVALFFAGSEFGSQRFGWLVSRALAFAGLGAAAGALAAVLLSVRRFGRAKP
ncbi:hypothetical protein FJY71_00200 [candidate division WOR-3 bacterium]|nr:hypothetical protein [candidate division WOR-3 bacterium]